MASKFPWDISVIPFGAILVTVMILPNWTYDPISAPKQFLLAITATISLGLFLNQGIPTRVLLKEIFPLLILFFVVLLTINIFVHNEVLSERFFGIRGRSTGLITYISFAIIAFIASKRRCIEKFFYSMLISNIVVSGYFTLQFFGIDVFVFDELYSAPSSTLGNPNFVSGFVGFSVFSLLYFVDQENRSAWIPMLAVAGMNLFVLIKSGSTQGVIALSSALLSLALWQILALKKRALTILTSIAVMISVTILFFGLLGRGLLANYLGSSTTFSRLDYWRAAIRMLFDNPIFGVGLDGYRDSYRIYRDESAIQRFGASQIADSSHSVFLDLLSAGGFPLGITFLLITIFPAYLVLQKIVRARHRDRRGILLLSVWIAFQVQAMSSVYNLGVGIWGWFLLGSMMSYAQDRGEMKLLARSKNRSSKLRRTYLAPLVVILGFVLPAPQLIAEARFLSLAKQGNGQALSQLVMNWPQDSARINLVAQGWRNSGDLVQAKQLVLNGLEKNPNYYPHWELLLSLANASGAERTESRKQLRRLDPLEG